jgi:hypothetical protein
MGRSIYPCRMTRDPARARRLTARVAALPALWAITAALMVRDHVADAYDSTRTGTDSYGHNHDGALLQGLGLTLLELVIIYALLRPRTYERSWSRPLGALFLLVPWTGLSMIMTMHAGGIVALHFLWLASLVLILFVLSLWSGLAALGARAEERAHKTGPTAPT